MLHLAVVPATRCYLATCVSTFLLCLTVGSAFAQTETILYNFQSLQLPVGQPCFVAIFCAGRRRRSQTKDKPAACEYACGTTARALL
jgi:hypothetical protein